MEIFRRIRIVFRETFISQKRQVLYGRQRVNIYLVNRENESSHVLDYVSAGKALWFWKQHGLQHVVYYSRRFPQAQWRIKIVPLESRCVPTHGINVPIL